MALPRNCPICRKEAFELVTVPEFGDRVFEDIGMENE
jgi:hypothetical protein